MAGTEVHESGVNYRLPDVLAALGSNQLTRLTRSRDRRTELHARYTEGLAGLDELVLPPHPAGRVTPRGTSTRCASGTADVEKLFDDLRDNGIGVQVNYIPVYWHPVYADQGYRRGMCPEAETYYEEEISLPLFPDLADGDVDRVVDAVKDALS